MAKMVQRRPIRSADPEAKGPGGTLIPLLAPLTPVGWLSVATALIYLAVQLLPFATGEQELKPDEFAWWSVGSVVYGAAFILLPAALQLGFPGVRRRNRWLFRGAVLLALSEVALLAVSAVGRWAFSTLTFDPGSGDDNPYLTFQTVMQVVGFVHPILLLAALAALYRGLRFAGAGVSGLVLAMVVTSVVVIDGIASFADLFQAFASSSLDGTTLLVALDIIAVVLGLASLGGSVAVAVLLIAGATRSLVPRSGWRFGAIYGAVSLLVLAITLLQVWLRPTTTDGSTDMTLLTAISALRYISPLMLVAAFALGLGRGTDERLAETPKVARYWVTGERRLREAGA